MEIQLIQSKIIEIRGCRVILDYALAELYQVETRSLKQAVKRNSDRFPSDFMFELTDNEIETMVSQNVIPSKKVFGGARPFAFNEQGSIMVSSILRSPVAIQVNISIMRAFVMLRKMAVGYEDLRYRLEELERDMDSQFGEVDEQFKEIYEALTQLLSRPQKSERKRIGYIKTDD